MNPKNELRSLFFEWDNTPRHKSRGQIINPISKKTFEQIMDKSAEQDYLFINAWNEYTVSTVLISTQTNRPITVGITQFSSFNMIEWQYLFAAALLATVPVIILFMLIEKHLAAGLTAGGVKG